MATKRLIVIGAGIGGLACAARLAVAGYQVTVLEQNAEAGGKLGLLQQDGFSWDTGPSLFTQPQLLERLFADCGKRLEDYFQYQSLNFGTQYFWDNGMHFHAAPDREYLHASALEAFGEDAGRLRPYLEDAKRLYERIGNIFLDYPIHRFSIWKPSRVLPALYTLKAAYLLQSLHAYNTRSLKHPKLVQVMDRMATYNGSDPYECPAMLSMIAHLEFGEGAYYPVGGMISIPRALRRLCLDLGVVFVQSRQATRILLEGHKVSGAEADGERLSADAVVSNSDVYYTYRYLLRDPVMAMKIARQERSSSGVVFYWGMSKRFPELRLHNIFFAEDYRTEFNAIFRDGCLPKAPTVYLNITSKVEPEHAVAGGENWFVLINAPARNVPFSREEIERLREAVLQKVSRSLGADVQSFIASEAVLTPDGIDRGTGAYLGALYGTASNSPMAAFNRHPNFSSRYPRLFFAGGTVHPGGGIPLCLRSGRLAAEAAVRWLKQ